MHDGVIKGPKHEHAFGGQHRHTGKAYGRQARSKKSRHAEVRGTKGAESGMRPKKSRADPEDIRGGQRESKRVGNGVWEDRTRRKVRALNMVDRVETVVRRTSSSVVDWMEPTVRDHSAEMVDREAMVVRVDGVVFARSGRRSQASPRGCQGLGWSPWPKISRSFPFWHTGGCAVRWGRMS